MAKNIAVSDEVYKLLSQLKLDNESFSGVIKRLLPPKSSGKEDRLRKFLSGLGSIR
ncbi:MAG: antitoxin VapB family protein, partial [Candidatus Hodarchaeota archaeon]